MNGLILLIPFFLIRFGLLLCLNKEAVKRAAHFAPLQGFEVIAYWIYQIFNIGIFVYLAFLKISDKMNWLSAFGLGCYLIGLVLCIVTMVNFSSPEGNGLNAKGLYKYSRNPMYLSYFICFVGMSILTKSIILFCMVIVFQMSSHWIILSEERWCIERIGADYKKYMKKVRRYF